MTKKKTPAVEPGPTFEAVTAFRIDSYLSDAFVLTIDATGQVVAIKRLTRAPDTAATVTGKVQAKAWDMLRSGQKIELLGDEDENAN